MRGVEGQDKMKISGARLRSEYPKRVASGGEVNLGVRTPFQDLPKPI